MYSNPEHFLHCSSCPTLHSPALYTCYVTLLRAGRSKFGCRRDWIFLIIVSRPALRPTQSPLQWGPGTHFPEIKWSENEPNNSYRFISKANTAGPLPPFQSTP